ncbi:MAG: hypothetical protein AAFY82_01500 [Pseudomonadota bacterium]
MLYPEEKDPSEHFRRAGRGAGIFLNQLRLGVLVLLSNGIRRAWAMVVEKAISFLSVFRGLHLPSARQIWIALACCAFFSLIALSDPPFVEQFSVPIAREAAVVLISVVVVCAILLCLLSMGVAARLVRNRRAKEKRPPKTPSKTGPLTNFSVAFLSLVDALKVGATWVRKLAADLKELCKYVVRSTPSALLFYGSEANASSASTSNEQRHEVQERKDIHFAEEPEIGNEKLDDIAPNHAVSNRGRGNSTNAWLLGWFNNTRELHETDSTPAKTSGTSREIWTQRLSAAASVITRQSRNSSERAIDHLAPEVTSPAEGTQDKSFSALSISIFSKSINSVSVAAIELFSFTRNSFSLLNVSAFAASVVAFAFLTISLISITVVDVPNSHGKKAGAEENRACENCILWGRFSKSYLARLSAFVAPRRNFDVGEGSYYSWPLGNSNIEMSIPQTQALCGTSVVIAAGMSSRSGSLEVNIRIAEARSHEAAREVEEAIGECSPDESLPRIVRVVLAERYVQADDASERLSLYLTSKVGDVSRARIMSAVDAALNEDVGLVSADVKVPQFAS